MRALRVLAPAALTLSMTMAGWDAVALVAPPGRATPASPPAPATEIHLDTLDGLDLVHVRGEMVEYRGRRAIHLVDEPRGGSHALSLAVIGSSSFANGTVTLDVAGGPRPGSPDDARGFIGLAFHVQPRASRFECIYLRMTNGHADDPVRRGHAVQYISYPAFPFDKLRKERPGVYEAPADVEPGVWTRMKIVVSGSRARLYLHGSTRPALAVDDLKLGEGRGQLGLWLDADTDAYYSHLTVQPDGGLAQLPGAGDPPPQAGR
jgi:hypothetical protein